jgi:hypothetical protein
MRRDNIGFVVLTTGYLAATTGESLLAPVFPQAGKELGMGTGAAGVTFAIERGDPADVVAAWARQLAPLRSREIEPG